MSLPLKSLLLISVVAPKLCVAQVPDSLASGARIRVVARCEARDPLLGCRSGDTVRTYTGQLMGVDRGNLHVRVQPSLREIVIPAASIDAVSVGHGTRGHFEAGAGIGSVVGGLIGLAAAASDSHEGDVIPPDLSKLFGAVAGTVGGLLLGGFIGAQIRTDNWVPLSRGISHVRLTPRLDGRGFAVTVPF